MEFAAPLYGLLIVPVGLVLLLTLRGERARNNRLRNFAEPHLLHRLLPTESRTSKTARLILPAMAMVLLVIAIMRPQWGLVNEERSTSGLDVVFAIDLSRSMLADDLTPSRLIVAKQLVTRALATLPSDRVGIIGFAGTAFPVCPLTSDHEMVTRILGDLGVGTLPRGGSSLAAMLKEAKRAFRNTPPGGRMLIVVSDGEDHDGDVAPALAELREAGVTIIAVPVGTVSGGLMPLPDGNFVKDKAGAVVKSKMNMETLSVLDPAALVADAEGSGLVERIAASRRALHETGRKEQRRRLAERYYLPLAGALILWCLGAALPVRRATS